MISGCCSRIRIVEVHLAGIIGFEGGGFEIDDDETAQPDVAFGKAFEFR